MIKYINGRICVESIMCGEYLCGDLVKLPGRLNSCEYYQQAKRLVDLMVVHIINEAPRSTRRVRGSPYKKEYW